MIGFVTLIQPFQFPNTSFSSNFLSNLLFIYDTHFVPHGYHNLLYHLYTKNEYQILFTVAMILISLGWIYRIIDMPLTQRKGFLGKLGIH